MNEPITLLDRYHGAMLGLAAGDALGTTVEFRSPGSFTPLTDIVGGGPFALEAGEWTDDTSMALCLAASLVETGRFDLVDQLTRYVEWWQSGYMSSNGRCFDIGNTVRDALERFRQTGDPHSGATHPKSAGNGSLMRLAPVSLAFARDPRVIELAGESSRTTHGAEEAVDACRYYSALIVGALEGASKDELLAQRFELEAGYWESHALAPAIAEIADGSFRRKEPPDIRGTGYVVKSLEAALWAFARSTSFAEGALLAVNLGDDADTTGAIYGQLAGAFYGVSGIPSGWLAKLAKRELLESLATRLYEMSEADVQSPVGGSQVNRPIGNSYWVRPGALLAGEYPGNRDEEKARGRVAVFLDAGVTEFIDLTEEGELVPYDHLLREEAALRGVNVVHRRLSIRDLSVPRDRARMRAILDAIDAAGAAGRVVYVHCWGGIGRTGTVIGCHLVRRGLTGDAALERLAQKWRIVEKFDRRPESPETEEQREYVRGWREER